MPPGPDHTGPWETCFACVAASARTCRTAIACGEPAERARRVEAFAAVIAGRRVGAAIVADLVADHDVEVDGELSASAPWAIACSRDLFK